MEGFQGRELIEEMSLATGARSRFEILTRNLLAIGLDTINYAVFEGASEPAEAGVHFLTTLSDEFMAYYHDEGLDEGDPHVRRLREGHLSPYAWSEVDLQYAQPNERPALAAGVEAGLRSTLCVPLPAPLSPFMPAGAFNLGSSMSARDFELVLKEHGAELVTIAHIFHNASIRQVWAEHEGVRALSTRERDCLRYLMAGLRHDAIAHAMGLAVVTVEVHVSNARRKLGARTAAEAVGKALARGEITL